MITVSVFINGTPIFTRSAVNQAIRNSAGETEYLMDDGLKIYHRRELGAVRLAVEMLKTIKEQGVE
jgi:hypothetical protein